MAIATSFGLDSWFIPTITILLYLSHVIRYHITAYMFIRDLVLTALTISLSTIGAAWLGSFWVTLVLIPTIYLALATAYKPRQRYRGSAA